VIFELIVIFFHIGGFPMFAWRATPAHNVSIPLVVTHTVEGEAAVSNTDS
jgi:heme exporter protein D